MYVPTQAWIDLSIMVASLNEFSRVLTHTRTHTHTHYLIKLEINVDVALISNALTLQATGVAQGENIKMSVVVVDYLATHTTIRSGTH
jgi:hypothetical protein